MFALGNTILFFGCMVYPLAEGLFSIFTHFGLLGNKTDYHCMVKKDVPQAIYYNDQNDYNLLIQNILVTDVSIQFRAVNIITIFCMIFLQSAFILNYYYNYLESLPHLKNRMFFISVGINTLLFLAVFV